MIKYRVKTEQEFLEEFGENWRHPMSYRNGCERTGYYFNKSMDFLLGTELTDYVDEGSYITIPCFVWCISKDMIKEINVINYNEKKVLVYD